MNTIDEQEGYTKYGVEYIMQDALSGLQAIKPNDRSELDRRIAVTITELEKVLAYYKTYVL